MQTKKFTVFVVAAIAACVLMLPVSTSLAKQPSPEPGKQMMTARWTDKAPQIDGVMGPGEWSAAIPVHVNFVKPTSLGPQWETPANPDDLNFTIYTMYDAFSLYIAVDVADNALFAGPNIWDGDAVEVFVDGDRVNGCPPPGDPLLEELGVYAVWSSCTPQQGINDFLNWDKWADFIIGGDDMSVWRVEGKEGFQLITDFQGNQWNWYSPEFLSLQWSSAPGLRPRGYVVEWRIALESIDTKDGPGEKPPGPGDVIGFDIAVDENDGAGQTLQGWWGGMRSEWAYLHEDEWGLLYFEPQPKGKAK